MSQKIGNQDQINVTMQPVGRRVSINPGMNLLEAARMSGIDLISLCGGIGSCEACRICLVSGDVSQPTPIEEGFFSAAEISAGHRFACQSIPISDVIIYIPSESLTTPQRLQIEGLEQVFQPEPGVLPVDVNIPPPNLKDLRSDTTRLISALSEASGLIQITIEYPVLATFSTQIRTANWCVKVAMRNNRVVSVLPRHSDTQQTPTLLGIAIDIGTTKLAAYLVDISTGNTLAKTGEMNPQIVFGEDVISRIAYSNSHESIHRNISEGRWALQNKLIHTLNTMIVTMCDQLSEKIWFVSQDQIVDAVVVGNTAMHHFFAGLPVNQLGASPYVPSVSEAVDIRAIDIGLNIAPGANIHLPPNIAGYVGADHVSMLLATIFNTLSGDLDASQTIVALDIGTNTEITLVHRGRLLSCSCASGPAFEGAHIRDGMRAAPGAIERVQIFDGDVRIKTIGDQPPIGICGSGILDTVSEMYRSGILDFRGSFLPGHPRVRTQNNHEEFLVAPAATTGHGRDVIVTRKDINEIQLAKGAIRAGLEIMLADAGVSAEEITQFIIAGAFGTYIDTNSAMRIGMFPNLPMERFQQVGNAAGMGARQMLISKTRRRLASRIADMINYIELSNHPNFTNEFSKALFFPL